MHGRIGVALVAQTSPDWTRFVAISKELFHQSPTRDLDKAGVVVGDAGSFAMAIEVMNSNREAVNNLNKAFRSLDFINLVFIVNFEDGDMCDVFCNMLNIAHLLYTTRGSGTVLLNGTLKQIKDIIVCLSNNDELRPVTNQMYEELCKHGLRTLCTKDKVKEDNTFTLR